MPDLPPKLRPFRPASAPPPPKIDNRPDSWARGYTGDWRKLRRVHIAANPLCKHCEQQGLIVPAKIVDHIIPFADRPELRLEPSNLQSLCTRCHNQKTHREQKAKPRQARYD